MRAAALAAARGEPLPEDAVAQLDSLNEPVAPKAVAEADVPQPVVTSAPAVQSTDVEASASPAASSIDKTNLTAADWPHVVSELDVAGMPLQLANNCTWSGMNSDRVQLQLEESAEHLNTERFVERLRNALSEWFGRDMRLTIDQVAQSLETPAKISQKQAEDDMAAAHDSIKLDPIVRQLIEQVDGAVDEASIRPLNRPPSES